MGGDLPEAITQTREKALIDHLLDALAPLKPEKTIVVTGHKQELLKQHLADSTSAKPHAIEYAFQEQQRGTGDAVKSALSALCGSLTFTTSSAASKTASGESRITAPAWI